MAPPRPAPTEKQGGRGLAVALIGAFVVVGAGAGYYFGVMKPNQERSAQAAHDSTARAESLVALARAESTARDTSRAAADTAKGTTAGATKGESADGTKRPTRPTTTPATAVATRPGTTPATTPTTTRPAATPGAATPGTTTPAGREGTIRLGGSLPAGARVMLNGQQRTGTEFRVPAGNYALRVEAQGYRPFEQQVTVAAGALRPVKVQMLTAPATATGSQPAGQPGTQPAGQPGTQPATQPAASAPPAGCTSNPTMSVLNVRRACYDTRPTPRTPTLLPRPASCTGRVTPVNILVQVSTAGEVVGNPTVSKASNCAAFNAQAQAQALDLTFSPATKNGQPVVAWIIVPFRPTR